jgi:hypothetical protein
MIGEMWDLEALCNKSVELGRNTCFVSSVPLKVMLDSLLMVVPPHAMLILTRSRFRAVWRVHQTQSPFFKLDCFLHI